MLLYITDSKKTKHPIRVEGIESITFENNPAIITFNYLNGSKKELHMVEQDFKAPSENYVVDKLWEWVSAGLIGKPKQLTALLGGKSQIDSVKHLETDEDHSENKTYLRISKFHESFEEKQVIPVDDITSITVHKEDIAAGSYEYLLFTTTHKNYKLILVYTYNDLFDSDITNVNHPANIIKDQIIDLIKSKSEKVLTYNPIEFISFSYSQPYADDGYFFFHGKQNKTWDLEKAFDFTSDFDQIQTGKKQDECLYAFDMHDVYQNVYSEISRQPHPLGFTIPYRSMFDVGENTFIQLGATRSDVPADTSLTNFVISPPVSFTYDILGQEKLEGTGKWLGQWAPSKAVFSVKGWNGQELDSVPENPTLADVVIDTVLDTENKIPAQPKWGQHSVDSNNDGFITFWNDDTKQYVDVAVNTGVNQNVTLASSQPGYYMTTSLSPQGTIAEVPNVFNPVYGMLCKEDGVYRVNVSFEDILLVKHSYPEIVDNWLTAEQSENVEAYITIKIHEAVSAQNVANIWNLNGAAQPGEDDARMAIELSNAREHSFGPFFPSERGFNLKSSFIIPGAKDITFFKFLITIVNKNAAQKVRLYLDSRYNPPLQNLHNTFEGSDAVGFTREKAAHQFQGFEIGTHELLDTDQTPYVWPVNKHTASLLHIEKIAELPNKQLGNPAWVTSTSVTTESGEKVLKQIAGVPKPTILSSVYGYGYGNGQGIGAGNL